jgi:hypothetical protein
MRCVEDHRTCTERKAGGAGRETHLGEAHRPEHLRAEHARVANLYPLVEAVVPVEDLHAGLRVRVVGRLEADVMHAQLGEESLRAKSV